MMLRARRLQLVNFALFQAAWFAAVLGAAHGNQLAGIVAVVAVLCWHLAVVARPEREAMLLVAALLLGIVVEAVHQHMGWVRFEGAPLAPGLPPSWLLLLWPLLACTLNVTLRWLHGHPLRAALCGAIAGPLAFWSGVRMGAAQFTDMPAALASLAFSWTVAMPVMVALAERLDGVVPDIEHNEAGHG